MILQIVYWVLTFIKKVDIKLFDSKSFKSSFVANQLADHLRIKSNENRNLIRFGSTNDGGYVLEDQFMGEEIVISLGIGANYSWDTEIATYVSRVLMYDHTIEPPLELRENMFFYPLEIAASSVVGKKVSVPDILKAFQNDTRFILKMDIEGAEYSVLESMQDFELHKFEQIIIEFHGIEKILRLKNHNYLHEIFLKLEKSHELINFHPNNYCSGFFYGGHPFADVFELTYVKKSTGNSIEAVSPRDYAELNQRCDPNSAELRIKY